MSKITESARGEPCTIRTPWCTPSTDNDTTVYCHAPSGMVFGRGSSLKSPDLIGAYGCHPCHDVIDGRAHIHETTYEERRTMFLRGFGLTIRLLIAKGLVTVAD